jgi:hypothetical protein
LAASNCRYGRKIPASNYLIRPENSAASNCRYGQKIPASNYQIRPENSASCNYRSGWKIQARKTTNCTQGCSGAVVEYLLSNLKVGGSRLHCAQTLFHYTAGKFRWRRKINRKFRLTCKKLFSLYVQNESAAPGLGSGKSRQSL